MEMVIVVASVLLLGDKVSVDVFFCLEPTKGRAVCWGGTGTTHHQASEEEREIDTYSTNTHRHVDLVFGRIIATTNPDDDETKKNPAAAWWRRRKKKASKSRTTTPRSRS
jgi:hypothetical protein